MTQFPANDVLAECATYAPQLVVPEVVGSFRLMIALAAVESSLGANCGPRHEPAYDTGGELYATSQSQQDLIAQYGTAAACSYGPWQMMFDNFSETAQVAIAGGTVTLQDYAVEFVRFFNRYVMGFRKPQTLAEIGDVWNLGHIGPDPDYVAKLQAAYDAAPAG